MPPANPNPNRILSRLNRKDFQLIEGYLEAVDLPLRKPLETRNRRVEYVYFIESGMASVVAKGGQRDIEIGIIGREGMSGLSVVLCANGRPVNDTFMQIAGNGRRLKADDLRDVIAASVELHAVLLRYAHAFLIQTSETALANGRSKIEERLARWLLMAHDRVDGDEVPLTHEFLSVMLGVQRSGVTMALQALERTGLISHRRGMIKIIDCDALERNANGAYTPLKDD